MSRKNDQLLRLSPRQNQDFRLLLRVCQRSLTAIDGFGCPLVSELIPFHATSPALFDALLAMAGQVRAGGNEAIPGGADGYHQALVKVRSLIEHQSVAAVDSDSDSDHHLLAAVSGAVILVLLSFAGPDTDWQHHAQQMIQLIDCADRAVFTSSPLGQFLLMAAAHIDTPAGAVGRSIPSWSAWSRWGVDALPRLTDQPFSHFEIISGQPHSLASLIAQIGHCADGRMRRASLALDADSHSRSHSHDGGQAAAEWHYLKSRLDHWEAPELPSRLPDHQRLALLTAWRTTIRAARLYHLREHGFYSNLSRPITDHSISQESYLETVQDLAVGIRFLLDDFKANNTTVANAMAWPLAVLGSECGSELTCHLQGEVVKLIEEIAQTFLMSHLRILLAILRHLWAEQMLCAGSPASEPLSLESTARKQGLSVPLL